MRIDNPVPADQRTGVSVYYNDYKRALSVDYSRIKPSSAFRRNKPHPGKEFLEPKRIPEEGAALQKRVRVAVRKYLNEAYKEEQANSSNSAIVRPPLFKPPSDDEDLEPKILRPLSPQLLQYRVKPTVNYQVQRPEFETHPSLPLTVKGTKAARPSSAVLLERSPPPHLDGETKRDISKQTNRNMKPKDNPTIVKWKLLRGLPKISPHIVEAAKKMAPEKLRPHVVPGSVRIKESIRQRHRLPTPQENRKAWQKRRTTPIPPQNKPHWVGSQDKTSLKPKRIVSAPPGIQGYTYYPQGRKDRSMDERPEDMTLKLEAWSKNASNYEKEVIYNMLKQVTPHADGQPSTPMSGDFTRVQNGPAADYHRPGYKPEVSMSYPHPSYINYEKQKTRKVHSAPLKTMGGLVPAATQRPFNDKRIYRLKGQDTRLNPSPGQERELNQYMDHMEVASSPVRFSQRRVNVPMHTYLPKESNGKQDYQCKVSFFQSVRSPFKKDFVIHPDFTSEGLKKRKPVSHTITHFRY